MIALTRKIDDLIEPLRRLADCVGSPLYDLLARLYIADAFWSSGMTRWKDFINGNFDKQLFLFELEHPVPGIPPDVAAYTALAGEVILPILLVLGLFGRVGGAGVLIMTAVIELTYVHAIDHILWMFLAASIFIKGPGKISLDYLILKFIRKA